MTPCVWCNASGRSTRLLLRLPGRGRLRPPNVSGGLFQQLSKALSSRWPIGLALTLAVLIPVSVRAQKNFPSGLKPIAAVRLEGRRRVPAKELWVVLKTRRPSFFPWRERPVVRLDFLSADARAIEQVYRQHGYLDAHAEYRLDSGRDPNAAIVTFTIQAGPQSRVSALEFTGVHAVPEEALRKKLYLRPGQPFNPFAVIVDTARISAVYKERGMLPHVVASVHRESLKVTVRYQVEEGPVYRNGQVYLSSPGESRVKEKLVRRELLLKPGDVYR